MNGALLVAEALSHSPRVVRCKPSVAGIFCRYSVLQFPTRAPHITVQLFVYHDDAGISSFVCCNGMGLALTLDS